MKLYFADTWFFVALLSRRDSQHRQARALERSLKTTTLLLTHDSVLTELLAFFAESGRVQAADYVRTILNDPGVVVVAGTRELFWSALALYQRRVDKGYSLVDCMSMHLMQMHGVTHVLTNDHHFTQEGFTIVNE